MSDAQTWDKSAELAGIGKRLKEERVKVGISQRELARRLGLSASLISQLESGRSAPSVGTLHGIVTELNVSMDRIIRGEQVVEAVAARDASAGPSPVVHPEKRQVIHLASGVRWEELSGPGEVGIDFLYAIYEVGGASTPDQALMRHHGREYGYIISGQLGIQIGFRAYELDAGDSIVFDSTQPHRLFNRGDVPVHAIWFNVSLTADRRAID